MLPEFQAQIAGGKLPGSMQSHRFSSTGATWESSAGVRGAMETASVLRFALVIEYVDRLQPEACEESFNSPR